MTKVYVKTFFIWGFDKLYKKSKIREEAIEQLNLFLESLSPQYEIINIIEEWKDNKTGLELILYYGLKRGE